MHSKYNYCPTIRQQDKRDSPQSLVPISCFSKLFTILLRKIHPFTTNTLTIYASKIYRIYPAYYITYRL